LSRRQRQPRKPMAKNIAALISQAAAILVSD
jgi:hypothetical protein